MNRNIHNYKWVNEQVLPFIDRNQFAYDFAVAIEQKQSYVNKFLGDTFNQTLTDVIYYRDTARLYKDIPQQKYKRLWNAYCFTYWSKWDLDQSVIDECGYIKWKDIGYEPTLIGTADNAYAYSERMSSSDPSGYAKAIASKHWWDN
jgi:hypothetical protein